MLEQILRPSFSTVSQRPGAVGRVFYVSHSNGVDAAGRGHDPSAALATITYALGLCTNNQNDYILVLDAWQEAMPIEVNKSTVHIIGVASLTPSRPSPCLAPAGDTAIFDMRAEGDLAEIAGFTLGGGVSHAAIEATGGPYGCYIHDCVFGHPNCGGTPLHGIYNTPASNMQNFRIERCVILGNGGGVGGTITGEGIWLQGGPSLHTQIVDCVIMGVDICIHLSNGDGVIIKGNILAPNANVAGSGITLEAGCIGTFAANNVANYGDTEMGQNPFTDNAGAGSNHWVNNMKGITLIMPA